MAAAASSVPEVAAPELVDEDLTAPVKELRDKWKLLPAFLQVSQACWRGWRGGGRGRPGKRGAIRAHPAAAVAARQRAQCARPPARAAVQ